MKLSYKMLRDLDKLCTAAAQLYEEHYVKDNGYGYEDEIDYQDMYNVVSNSFENGYLKEKNIDFEFGKPGTLKLLRDLKYSADAILYYPNRVIYHNEYRLIALEQTLFFTDLEEARLKKIEIVNERVNSNSLFDRYMVGEFSVEIVDDKRIITFLPHLDKNNLKNDSHYIINAFDGKRIEVYGKDQLISTLETERQREAANLSKVMIIEQKIEDTVDHFTAWMPV